MKSSTDEYPEKYTKEPSHERSMDLELKWHCIRHKFLTRRHLLAWYICMLQKEKSIIYGIATGHRRTHQDDKLNVNAAPRIDRLGYFNKSYRLPIRIFSTFFRTKLDSLRRSLICLIAHDHSLCTIKSIYTLLKLFGDLRLNILYCRSWTHNITQQ